VPGQVRLFRTAALGNTSGLMASADASCPTVRGVGGEATFTSFATGRGSLCPILLSYHADLRCRRSVRYVGGSEEGGAMLSALVVGDVV